MILPKQKLEAYGSRQAFGHNDSLLQCYPQPIVIIDALSGETTSSRRAPKRSLLPLSPRRKRKERPLWGSTGGSRFSRKSVNYDDRLRVALKERIVMAKRLPRAICF